MKMHQFDQHFINYLRLFGFSKTESKIIFVLLVENNQSAKQIAKKIGIKGPYIYKILNALIARNIISIEKKNPNQYGLINKKKFKQCLDSIIATSQEKFENQKNCFHEVLQKFEEFQKKGGFPVHNSIEKEISKISDKMPDNIKNKMINILKELKTGILIANEANMKINLKKGAISFMLSSAEFESPRSEKIITYGGIIYSINKTGDFDRNLQQEIHKYNLDMLKMAYKMESKGYVEEKKVRILKDFSFDGKTKEKDDILLTKYTINIEGKKLNGLISTFINNSYKNELITIWAENSKLNDVLKSEFY